MVSRTNTRKAAENTQKTLQTTEPDLNGIKAHSRTNNQEEKGQ